MNDDGIATREELQRDREDMQLQAFILAMGVVSKYWNAIPTKHIQEFIDYLDKNGETHARLQALHDGKGMDPTLGQPTHSVPEIRRHVTRLRQWAVEVGFSPVAFDVVIEELEALEGALRLTQPEREVLLTTSQIIGQPFASSISAGMHAQTAISLSSGMLSVPKMRATFTPVNKKAPNLSVKIDYKIKM